MASGKPIQAIQEEMKCPICMKYLTDPVTVECGHNFCQACINDYCEKSKENESLGCPVCKTKIQKGNLHPNLQLAKVVEDIKHLEFIPGAENLCVKHKKELSLFCEEDGAVVCVACERSPEHSSHKVLLIEEAVPKYKKQIQAELEVMREERKRLENLRVSESQKHQKYQETIAAERHKVRLEYEIRMAQLAEQDGEIEKSQKETVTQLSGEISRLDSLIGEMESKSQQPLSIFLKDIRSMLSRCKKGKFQLPKGISPELQKILNSLSQQTVKKMASPFPETPQSHLEKGLYSKVTVTLDPDTAHPCLFVSLDRRSVRYGDTRQRLLSSPEKFDTQSSVLGCERFTSGRRCWEVEVREGAFWAMGVAKESVKRKGEIRFSPEEGIWAVRRGFAKFEALTAPDRTALSLSRVPSRIRVCLDYGGGQVSFINAETDALIFTFPPASFAGARIRPWFWLWSVGSELKLHH